MLLSAGKLSQRFKEQSEKHTALHCVDFSNDFKILNICSSHAYAPFTKTPVSKYNSCHSLREMSDDEGWSFQDTKDSMKVFVADNETNCRAVFFQKEANGKVTFVSSVLNRQEVELSHNILQNLTSTDSYDKVCLGLRQYFNCKLCEGFKPNDENIVPNHNFMMNHHSNTVIATCNSQRQISFIEM